MGTRRQDLRLGRLRIDQKQDFGVVGTTLIAACKLHRHPSEAVGSFGRSGCAGCAGAQSAPRLRASRILGFAPAPASKKLRARLALIGVGNLGPKAALAFRQMKR
jgi:hypothetical protein